MALFLSAMVCVALVARPAVSGTRLAVRVWADATAAPEAPSAGNGMAIVPVGPGISTDFGVVFGPGGQNLFLSEEGAVYTSTGPVGSTPGAFTKLKDLPGDENEGSAFVVFASLSVLYVPSSGEEELYGMPVTGSGASVALGSITTFDGEDGPESGDTGQPMEFDEPEGVAVVETPLRFDDSGATPVFATSFSGSSLVVNGSTYPIVDPEWSGKTILLLNQEDPNLIAFRLRNDGTMVTPGVALGPVDLVDGEAVTTTQDGRFAFVPSGTTLYSVDLHNIDSKGGSAHIKSFDFTGVAASFDAVAMGVDGLLYATGKEPGGTGTTLFYAMGVSSTTGVLSEPQALGPIDDGQGHAATGYSGQMVAGDGCFLVPDDGSGLVFEVCPQRMEPIPAAGTFGMVLLGLALLALGIFRLRAAGELRST